MTVPLALATAVFLNETRSRFRRPVRIFVDAMSGLPSIVAGLFIYAVLILPFGETSSSLFGFNGFMASLALAMIMLPTVTRTVEVVLRLVPDGLREASLAMGASRARTVWSVVLPDRPHRRHHRRRARHRPRRRRDRPAAVHRVRLRAV